MATSASNKKKSEPLGQGTTNSRTGSCVEIECEVLTVSIFFDGTGNNSANTEAGLKSEQQRNRGTSYQNYYSNIALLFNAVKEQKGVHEIIYVEGAGTERNKSDDIQGMATATGSTGLARVSWALQELIKKSKGAHTVIVNVYGFSRGAAFARNFCYRLKNKNAPRTNEEEELAQKVSINLVGLYDTVSSFGIAHYDDVKEYGLDIGKAESILKVIHLTAQNEYRAHFPLTQIKGAVNDQIGFECSFPGAHSDIGGGYPKVDKNDGNGNKPRYLGLNDPARPDYSSNWVDYRFFKHKGYYTDQQLTFRDHKGQKVAESKKISEPDEMMATAAGQPGLAYNLLPPIKVYAERVVEYHYQFIFAEIMRDVIKKFASATQWKEDSELKARIAEMKQQKVLAAFAKEARQYVMDHVGKHGSFVCPKGAPREIYNQYIHNSLSYEDSPVNPNIGTPKNKGKQDPQLRFRIPIRPKVTEGFR